MFWAKTNAGMGSLYRSQHELLPLFKRGSAPHVNNVELGKAAAGARTSGPIRAPPRSAPTPAGACRTTRP